MTVQLRNTSGGILPLRFKLVNIQLVDQSLPKPCLTDSHRLLPCQQRALGDLQLHVELPKIEIRLRHAAHDLQRDGSSSLLPGQEFCQARLIRPADPPPD